MSLYCTSLYSVCACVCMHVGRQDTVFIVTVKDSRRNQQQQNKLFQLHSFLPLQKEKKASATLHIHISYKKKINITSWSPILSFLPSAGDFFLRRLNTINVNKWIFSCFSCERKKKEQVSQRVLHLQSGCYSCTWEPLMWALVPLKRWNKLYDIAGNRGAGIYLVFYVLVSQGEQVKQCMWVLCVCVMADLMLRSCLIWQCHLHDSHSEDRWQGLTLLRNPPTHTLRRDAQHKNFLGTYWLISQSNNESCIASSPTKCVCVCVSVWLAVCFDISPEVSKSDHSACCSLLVSHLTVPAACSSSNRSWL